MPAAKDSAIKSVMAAMLFVAAIWVAPAQAGELTPATSKFMNDFLNFSRLVAHTERGFLVKIYAQQDEGECDGDRYETCPKKRIWIAVSEYSDYPQHNVYPLPAADDWAFLGWTSRPGNVGGPDDFVVLRLRMSRRVPRPHPPDKIGTFVWVKTDYEIRVNPWHAYIEEIKAPATESAKPN
ncbi:MAG TPA: hypothetical protein VMF53_03175 [Alphaproteobacteria bacterium]|nr:hypothetical protein [Alphaproteobacteria bacterium]